MRVALLKTKDTERSRYLMAAFEAGIRAHGDTAFVVTHKDSPTVLDGADVGMQICYPNRHHDGSPMPVFRLAAYERFVAAGKRVITLDTGFIRSQSDAELMVGPSRFDIKNSDLYPKFDDRIYYSVGYDGIKNSADYCTGGVGSDRWSALRTPMRPWRRGGTHILLIGQPVHGLSSQHADIYTWYGKAVKTIRKQVDRPIVFRPHPRVASIRSNAGRRARDEVRVRQAIGNTSGFRYSRSRLLADDLRDAWAVVAFTSNAAVAAAIAGIPVFAGDRVCMAWDVANTDLATIKTPKTPDRQGWVARLAYSQWNTTEIRRGECWAHLRPHAHKRGK